MLRRLLVRKGMSVARCSDSAIAALEHRGSAYLPAVNAFCIREFQMVHAAEDAARFLHHACQGLPQRLAQPSVGAKSIVTSDKSEDRFYARVIENTRSPTSDREFSILRGPPRSADSGIATFPRGLR